MQATQRQPLQAKISFEQTREGKNDNNRTNYVLKCMSMITHISSMLTGIPRPVGLYMSTHTQAYAQWASFVLAPLPSIYLSYITIHITTAIVIPLSSHLYLPI